MFLAQRSLQKRIESILIKEGKFPSPESSADFQDARAKAIAAMEDERPTSRNQVARLRDRLTQVAPDWQRRQKLVNLRMKTLLRIYISKWFYFGLKWEEKELLLLLLEKTNCYTGSIVNSYSINQVGLTYAGLILVEDEEKSPAAKGYSLAEEVGNFDELLYSEQELTAIQKLRSFQSLRDFIFVEATGHEHEGKTGIKKQRQRGYRDGRSSPRDKRLTQLALRVDTLFWEEKFQTRLDNFYSDLEALCKT
jgi:hypothetical protein